MSQEKSEVLRETFLNFLWQIKEHESSFSKQLESLSFLLKNIVSFLKSLSPVFERYSEKELRWEEKFFDVYDQLLKGKQVKKEEYEEFFKRTHELFNCLSEVIKNLEMLNESLSEWKDKSVIPSLTGARVLEKSLTSLVGLKEGKQKIVDTFTSKEQ
jgi:hypothetical protein